MRGALTKLTVAVLLLAAVGCSHLPGKPGFRPETMRPDQTRSFAVLYQANCAACHGDNGRGGAALPLDNPVYLAWAGQARVLAIVENGVPGRQMPAFSAGGGGLLTGAQVHDIVNGLYSHWSRTSVPVAAGMPSYAASGGNAAEGQQAFGVYCARCHGAQGQGIPAAGVTGSILDPTYLSLISRQGLRDIIVSGMPGEGMPDWQGDAPGKALRESDVDNIVAWLISHRVANPGQPFPPGQH